MSGAFNPARRQLLRGDVGGRQLPLRAPWSLPEAAFVAACSRCERCIAACPQGILVVGSGGFPEVDFQRGECTFCGDCARACPDAAFRPTTESPWQLQLRIADSCVARRQVVCRSCGESCEREAIRFPPRLNRSAEPLLDPTACNGCGACVAVCPTQAISLVPDPQEA